MSNADDDEGSKKIDIPAEPVQADAPELVELLGGCLTPDGVLYDRAEIEEIGGVEEDLIGKEEIPIRPRLEGVVFNLVTRLLPSKEDRARGASPIDDRKTIQKLLLDVVPNDILLLLARIRCLAPSATFEFPVTCPRLKCQQTVRAVKNLRELVVTPMPDKRVRVYDVPLPRCGKLAKMRVMLAHHENDLEDAYEKHPGMQSTAELFVRTTTIGGEPATMEMIQGLKKTDRDRMRWAFEKREAQTELTIPVACKNPECRYKFRANMNFMSDDFFFPPETSTPSPSS